MGGAGGKGPGMDVAHFNSLQFRSSFPYRSVKIIRRRLTYILFTMFWPLLYPGCCVQSSPMVMIRCVHGNRSIRPRILAPSKCTFGCITEQLCSKLPDLSFSRSNKPLIWAKFVFSTLSFVLSVCFQWMPVFAFIQEFRLKLESIS